MLVDHDELYDLAKQILEAAGADEGNAADVAEHLVSANLSGVDTHGVWHLPGYVKAIESGELVPTARPEALKEGPNHALVTGNWTFGQVAAKFATRLAIKKAHELGMAIVGLVQSHHIGRLGFFVEMATAEEMIAMVWAGGYGEEMPAAVPYGGRDALLHTNPVAMGFPARNEPPIMYDFATSAMSGVKVVNAQRRGESLPPGAIVDKDGNPTVNPNDFFDGGAHLPFGGHKGYALMMAAEYMGRVFTGSDAYVDPRRGGPVLRHQGVTIIVVRADLFQPADSYLERAGEMADRARAVRPAPGFDRVLVPGDPEARARATRRLEGIPIPDDVWQSVVDLAETLGVETYH